MSRSNSTEDLSSMPWEGGEGGGASDDPKSIFDVDTRVRRRRSTHLGAPGHEILACNPGEGVVEEMKETKGDGDLVGRRLDGHSAIRPGASASANAVQPFTTHMRNVRKQRETPI